MPKCLQNKLGFRPTLWAAMAFWWVLGAMAPGVPAPAATVDALSEVTAAATPAAGLSGEIRDEASLREMLSRMAHACGMVGKGTVRVIVLPVELFSPPKITTEDLELEALAHAEREETRSYWFPNTMIEGKLTTQADLESELRRLLAGNGGEESRRSGAPSPVLLGMLEANHREVRENARIAAVAARSALPGEHLGRGAPWRPVPAEPPGTPRSPVQVRKSGTPPANSTRPSGDPERHFVAVVFQGTFHVFDEDPRETFPIELSGEQVGRVRGQGKEWAWMQLDSGLMGVMRNKFLRQASPEEVERFLASEQFPQGARADLGFDIGIIDLDAEGHPIQSEAGEEMPPERGTMPPAEVPGPPPERAPGGGEKPLKPLQ